MLFIFGCARSGTTLLSELLDSHDHVFISPETQYFQKIFSQRKLLRFFPLKLKSAIIINSLVKNEYSSIYKGILRRKKDKLAAYFNGQGDIGDIEGLVRVISNGEKVIGEKTPLHVFFADKLPMDSKIILIQRNPLPNVASLYKRKNFRNVSSLSACCARWNVVNREIIQLSKAYRENSILVKFEDLISNELFVMEQVADFLKIPFDQKMLVPRGQDSSNHLIPKSEQIIDREVNSRYKLKLSDKEIFKVNVATQYVSNNYSKANKRRSIFQYPLDVIIFLLVVSLQEIKLAIGIRLMRSGYYPFGALMEYYYDNKSE